DFVEHLVQPWKACLRCVVVRIGEPVLVANDFCQDGECLCLRDHVNVRVRIRLPALASDDPAWMASSRGIAGPRHGGTELAIGILRIFLEWTVSEALLVAQFHPAKVQHTILHRACDALTAPGFLALKQCSQNARYEVDAGTRVADLSAGHHRETS